MMRVLALVAFALAMYMLGNTMMARMGVLVHDESCRGQADECAMCEPAVGPMAITGPLESPITEEGEWL